MKPHKVKSKRPKQNNPILLNLSFIFCLLTFNFLSQGQSNTTAQYKPLPVPVPPGPVVVPVPPFLSTGGWQNVKLLHVLKAHWGPVYALTFSPDGKFMASGGTDIDTKIRLWNPIKGKNIRTIQAHSNRVLSLAITPDNLTIASGSEDTTLNL